MYFRIYFLILYIAYTTKAVPIIWIFPIFSCNIKNDTSIAVGISRFPIIDTFNAPICFMAAYKSVNGIISQNSASIAVYPSKLVVTCPLKTNNGNLYIIRHINEKKVEYALIASGGSPCNFSSL